MAISSPLEIFQSAFNGLQLFALFEDALDERGHLSVWIWKLGIRLGGFGRWCRGCDSREVDPLEPGCGILRSILRHV